MLALGTEGRLWAVADALGNDMDGAEFKNVVLGQLINLVSHIALSDPARRANEALSRLYEYFLSQFASTGGKKGGQFYTPTHVVRVLVKDLAPYDVRVHGAFASRSGGTFRRSEAALERQDLCRLSEVGRRAEWLTDAHSMLATGPPSPTRCLASEQTTSTRTRHGSLG